MYFKKKHQEIHTDALMKLSFAFYVAAGLEMNEKVKVDLQFKGTFTLLAAA